MLLEQWHWLDIILGSPEVIDAVLVKFVQDFHCFFVERHLLLGGLISCNQGCSPVDSDTYLDGIDDSHSLIVGDKVPIETFFFLEFGLIILLTSLVPCLGESLLDLVEVIMIIIVLVPVHVVSRWHVWVPLLRLRVTLGVNLLQTSLHFDKLLEVTIIAAVSIL